MAKTSTRLSAERIRQLAVTGATALLKQLRAEIVAIERTFPEGAAKAPPRGSSRSEDGEDDDTSDVDGSETSGVPENEEILGRAAQGTSEGQDDRPSEDDDVIIASAERLHVSSVAMLDASSVVVVRAR